MSYSYVKKESESLKSIWNVDREKLKLESVYFVDADGEDINHQVNIKELTIPATFYDEMLDNEPLKIKSIGAHFFNECSRIPIHIQNLKISNGITTLQSGAFRDIFIDIDRIEIPDGIKKIPSNCFKNNTRLKEVILPSSIKEIGVGSFYSTKNLETIVIPDNCKTIKYTAFAHSGIKSINMNKNVKEIESVAFWNCTNLTEFVWPEACSVIESQCFYNCTNLKKLEFPGAITKIEPLALKNTGITELNFSNSPTLLVEDIDFDEKIIITQ